MCLVLELEEVIDIEEDKLTEFLRPLEYPPPLDKLTEFLRLLEYPLPPDTCKYVIYKEKESICPSMSFYGY